jgi:hypothetical protein
MTVSSGTISGPAVCSREHSTDPSVFMKSEEFHENHNACRLRIDSASWRLFNIRSDF